MRIVGGRLRGRALIAPADKRVRPTSDRTRETLFNVLAHGDFAAPGRPRLPIDASVLDLFAGTGALGLEALSRGAARAVFVDDHPESLALLRRNTTALGLDPAAHVLRRDATRLGPLPSTTGGPFDLVLADPPYRLGLLAPALESARAGGWLAAHALVAAELANDEPLPAPDGFMLLDSRRSGAARLVILRRLPDAP